MSTERKRVELKPIPKAVPKKREGSEKPIDIISVITEPKASKEPKVKKVPEPKYVKIFLEGNQQDFKAIGDRVMKNEVVWSHYTTEGDKGYHYYLILPEKTQ